MNIDYFTQFLKVTNPGVASLGIGSQSLLNQVGRGHSLLKLG